MAALDRAPLRADPLLKYHFPFAAAPNIIRANQKDNFFQGALSEALSGILRKFYGAHFIHNHTLEARTFSELLYFGCTTLVGNRTLGEEYCDLLQVETGSSKLPSISLRSSYILSSLLLPYIVNKILPSFRNRLSLILEMSLQGQPKTTSGTRSDRLVYRIRSYFRTNLSNITSPAAFYALGLSVFYFTGSYYHISKRVLGLRYIFTKQIEPSDQRIGYEVLGLLMILQMTVQGWLHIRSTLNETIPAHLPGDNHIGGEPNLNGGGQGDLRPASPESNDYTIDRSSFGSQISSVEFLATNTNTPLLSKPRNHLADSGIMGWVQGSQQRRCTLCLEEMKDPSATTCGHVFCWTCITDWIREKPECPLCRHGILNQHVLPMR